MESLASQLGGPPGPEITKDHRFTDVVNGVDMPVRIVRVRGGGTAVTIRIQADGSGWIAVAHANTVQHEYYFAPSPESPPEGG